MSTPHDIVDRPPPLSAIDRLSLLLGQALAWVFLAGVVFTAWEVVLRYGFDSPTIWVHDLTIALTALAFIFGGAYSLQKREHIRISSIYDRIPPAWQRACDLLNAAAIIVFMAGFGWAAWRQAMTAIEVGETSGRAWDVPIPMVLKTALALGATLMLLQAIVNLVRDWRGGRR